MLAKLRAHAREQHAEPERLGDVVVGPRIEAEDGVGVGVGGGQHDDRHLVSAAPDHLAQLAAVDVGQPDVEQHEFVAVRLDAFERLAARRRLADIELVVELQLLGERLAQRRIVVDD